MFNQYDQITVREKYKIDNQTHYEIGVGNANVPMWAVWSMILTVSQVTFLALIFNLSILPCIVLFLFLYFYVNLKWLTSSSWVSIGVFAILLLIRSI